MDFEAEYSVSDLSLFIPNFIYSCWFFLEIHFLKKQQNSHYSICGGLDVQQAVRRIWSQDMKENKTAEKRTKVSTSPFLAFL